MPKFSCAIAVRFADLDMLGHVNNAVFFSYSEFARLEFFAAIGITTKAFPSCLLARVVVNHLKPVHYGDDLIVTTWVQKVGSKSFTVLHEVIANNIVCATLETVLVWYNHQSKTSLLVPDAVRAKLLEYTV
jgi:acyl-CoA thioester hydrolase